MHASAFAKTAFYFDVRLRDDAGLDLTDHVDLLRQSLRIAQKRRPFETAAAVVLPDALRMIWVLPAGDVAYAIRWHMIKAVFRRHAPGAGRDIWQPRFAEHRLRNRGEFARYADRIMSAPVRAGLVRQACDWPWSSVHHRAYPAPMPVTRRQLQIQRDAKVPAWLRRAQDVTDASDATYAQDAISA